MADPTNTPPVRPQFQAYVNCFAEVGKSPLDLIDFNAPVGTRRVNINRLRCLLLTEDRSDINRRIIELPNYFDCRDEKAAGIRAEIIRAAIKTYGGKDEGFLDEILAEIDEANATSLGWLASMISRIRDGWPRDPSARAGLDATKNFSVAIVGAIGSIIARAVPGASGYVNDAQTLLKLLVDFLFFIGDYVAEVEAAQKELAVRLLSYSPITTPTSPYGIGRVNTIRGAYAATNPGGASMFTVKNWCAAGNTRGKPYLAPDGTDGSYQIALADWQSRQATVSAQLPVLRNAFGGNYARFISANVIYAAIWNAYDFDDAKEIIEKEIMFNGSAGPVLFQSTVPLLTCGSPANEWQAADTLSFAIPPVGVCKFDYYAPFWEDTLLQNWNWKAATGIPSAKTIQYKKSILTAMSNKYFSIGKYKAGDGTFARPENMAKIKDFALELTAIHYMWQDYAKAAFPYFGKTKRAKKILESLPTVWDRLIPYVNYGWTFTGTSDQIWDTVVRLVLTGESAVGPMPVPSDPRYSTRKAPCPTGDTACLPCDEIEKTKRRPIGAKPIEIPTLLEWTPEKRTVGTGFVVNTNPYVSREFAAWKRRLVEAGYPDYYIDCLARKLTFKALGFAGGTPVLTNVPKITPTALRGAPVSMTGAGGLTSQTIALLNGGYRG